VNFIKIVIAVIVITPIVIYIVYYTKRKNSLSTITMVPRGIGDKLSTVGNVEINDERPALAASEEEQ